MWLMKKLEMQNDVEEEKKARETISKWSLIRLGLFYSPLFSISPSFASRSKSHCLEVLKKINL